MAGTSNAPAGDPLKSERPPARRKSAADRERAIVDAAIDYFADVGLDGTTHGLALRAGITQPLLYRYFPTKESLLDRIYEEIYGNRWDPAWQDLLAEPEDDGPGGPFPERLKRFYRDYIRRVTTRAWVRLFMETALAGRETARNAAFLAHLRDAVIEPICVAVRRRAYGKNMPDGAITGLERELAWQLHGGIFYIAARRDIYGLTIHTDDVDAIIAAAVDRHFAGAPAAVRRYLPVEDPAVKLSTDK